MKRILVLICAAAALTYGAATFAADAPVPKTDEAKTEVAVAPPKEEKSVTHGSVTVGGQRIDARDDRHRSDPFRRAIHRPPQR